MVFLNHLIINPLVILTISWGHGLNAKINNWFSAGFVTQLITGMNLFEGATGKSIQLESNAPARSA